MRGGDAADAPRSKLEAVRGYGAEVVLHDDRATLFDKLREEEAARGSTFVHPFDDPVVLAGAGTCGLEIIEDAPETQIVVVPVGGGGLMAGVASAVKAIKPTTRVIAVELSEGPGLGPIARGGQTDSGRAPAGTLADGMTPPFVGALPLEIVAREAVDEIVTVTEAEIIEAMKLLMTRAKLYVEGSGAAAFAALLAEKSRRPPALVVGGHRLGRQRRSRARVGGCSNRIPRRRLRMRARRHAGGSPSALADARVHRRDGAHVRALGRGDAVLPLRPMVWLPDRSGLLGLMPGYLGEPQSFGLKVVTVMPGNHGTAIRFASGRGDAVRHPARRAARHHRRHSDHRDPHRGRVRRRDPRARARGAGDLADRRLGRAGHHPLAAMRAVRKLRRVRVWSRSPRDAERFARGGCGELGFAIQLSASAGKPSPRRRSHRTTTSARDPCSTAPG